jgi:D-amino-acid dehydrogenase
MKVIIIGAGVQGVATAYFLRRHGAEVCVLERAEDAGMESSFGNGGGITISVPEPWNAPGVHKLLFQSLGKKDSPMLLRLKALPGMLSWGLKFLKAANNETYIQSIKRNSTLSKYSVSLMAEIREQTGLEYRYSDSGMLLVFRDQKALDGHIAHAGFLNTECEIESTAMNRDDLIRAEPSLGAVKEQLAGALYFPEDEAGDCHLFCKNLSEYLKKNDVQFRYDVNVSAIEQHDGVLQINLNEREVIKAEAVVVAAGAYSPGLVRTLDIRLPVYPAKGYSLSIPMSGWDNRPRHLMADMGLHAGLNPLGEILRVAGTAEFTGYDRRIPEERVRNLIGLVEAVFPELAAIMDRDNLNPWAGFRPMSSDGVPIIGRTNIEGLYLNTGQGSLGWTMSAASGRVLADTIMGETAKVDMSHYSIDRF